MRCRYRRGSSLPVRRRARSAAERDASAFFARGGSTVDIALSNCGRQLSLAEEERPFAICPMQVQPAHGSGAGDGAGFWGGRLVTVKATGEPILSNGITPAATVVRPSVKSARPMTKRRSGKPSPDFRILDTATPPNAGLAAIDAMNSWLTRVEGYGLGVPSPGSLGSNVMA